MIKELKLTASGSSYVDRFIQVSQHMGKVRVTIKVGRQKNVNLYFTKAEALWVSETIREVADTLGAIVEEKPEPPKPVDCENCGLSYDECTAGIFKAEGMACCNACADTATHKQDAWENYQRKMWKM